MAGPRLQNCKVEHRRAIDGRHVWYTYNLRRLVAAAANPAPVDASDMSFDEYADDLPVEELFRPLKNALKMAQVSTKTAWHRGLARPDSVHA